MALTLLKAVSRFRFLLVAALVALLFSTSFLSEADMQSASTQIVDAPSIVAGMASEIALQGNPYSNLEINIKNPAKTSLVLETVTDAKGRATVTVSDYHLRTAGIYQISSRELGNEKDKASISSFEVYTGPVSEISSKVEVSKNSAEAGETVELTVALLDAYENAIEGHILKVISNSEFVSVYTPEFTTNANGEMNFYISASKKGIFDFTIFDSSVNKTLSAKPKVAFSGNGDFAEMGGQENTEKITLASGSVDSFKLSGLDSGADVGDLITVKVTAIDEEGFTVSDYTSTIRFSSTDAEATLPNDYTFVADDQGEHSFSLAVKFVTPGSQTLTITDTESFNITGESTLTVSTGEDSPVDYDATFETSDFDRTGDFTLISPASGSYSSNTIEIQGEAEYGYTVFVLLNDTVVGHTDVEFDNSFSFPLQEVEDGDYELYADIVEVGLENIDELSDEEIDALYSSGTDKEGLKLIETSDSESITIDTTAPIIVSLDMDAEAKVGIVTQQSVTFTVLSEANLEEASLLFNEEIYAFDETATSGKYEVTLTMPAEAGEYGVDVILMDALGNEVQYRDQLALSVTAESTTADQPDSTVTGIETVSGVTVTGAEESVLISWEEPASENAIAFYRVYYGPSEQALFAVSETFDSTTSWGVADLNGEERYYFAVSAVDTEGNESAQSTVVLGVPLLGKEPADVDNIYDTSGTPEISGSESDIDGTPETGPAENAMLLVSAIAALGYMQFRKRAYVKSF